MTAARLNKADLRVLYASLTRLLPPQQLPTEPAEVVAISGVREIVASMIREYAPLPERGPLVFSWRVPKEQALTMNSYSGTRGWVKKKIRKALDDQLISMLKTSAFPGALMHGAQTRRWLRATRFSPRRVDELSADIIGAKCPIDALVRAGILAEDDDAHLIREAIWEKCRPGGTHLLVEVFEVRAEGTHADDAVEFVDTRLPPRVPGEMTAWLKKG